MSSEKLMQDPMVSHPAHYTLGSCVECLDLIRYQHVDIAQAIKYVYRWRNKFNPQQDLAKAMFFLQDLKKELDKGLPQHLFITYHESAENYILFNQHISWLESEGFELDADFFSAIAVFTHPGVDNTTYILDDAINALEELICIASKE